MITLPAVLMENICFAHNLFSDLFYLLYGGMAHSKQLHYIYLQTYSLFKYGCTLYHHIWN